MDLLLLAFLNQTVAHPVFDLIMTGFTRWGLELFLLLSILTVLRPAHRRSGWTLLLALTLGFGLAIIFKYVAVRPRPVDVRLITEMPITPAYPSGHAAGAFALATAFILLHRRPLWQMAILSAAMLIALSRVYLGLHYPSDILGGIILGTAVGAASYGLIGTGQSWPKRLSWLVWLQIAIALVVTQMAYLDILPWSLLSWPYADKVLHFVLIGSIAFWLNLWLDGRSLQVGRWPVPLALLLPFSLALIEEGFQLLSPVRTADLIDLSSDLLGLLFFWGLSERVRGLEVSSPPLGDEVEGVGDERY